VSLIFCSSPLPSASRPRVGRTPLVAHPRVTPRWGAGAKNAEAGAAASRAVASKMGAAMVDCHGRHGRHGRAAIRGGAGNACNSVAAVRRQRQRRHRHAVDRGFDRARREEPRKAQRGCGKAHRSQAGYHKVANGALAR
jgi:hypothetical protein